MMLPRYSEQVKSTHIRHKCEKLWDSISFSIYFVLFCCWFFFSVFYVGTWKQLPYLFASHIMESIHFLRFKRKAGEKKGQKRHKLTLSHAHAHLTILKMHGLSLFFAIRFAVIECDFSSAKWYSSLLRAHLLNAVGFWLHILFAKWFTIWFIISIYFLLARTHTETLWNEMEPNKHHKKYCT